MKTLKAIGFAMLSFMAANNAYQFIGTNYHTPYNIWVLVSFALGVTSLIFLVKKSKTL